MDPVIGLSLGRITLGAVTLSNPGLGAKLFQLDAEHNKQLPYMTRMFGSREIALGTLTLLASGRTRRRLVLAGIASLRAARTSRKNASAIVWAGV